MESSAEHAPATPARRTRAVPALAVAAVAWLALGAVLSQLTGRVAGWFVMTDELLYERLALSVDRLHSPLPHVHGVLVGSVNQLYPLLLAPVFATGSVGSDVHAAHVLNAFVMTSAALPAYLLARRVTRDARVSVLVAVLTAAVPWIVLSSFLLTEVAAYPAFCWALLGCQAAVAAPSRRADALAIGGLVLAVLARTQLAVLVVVLPATLLVAALGDGARGREIGRRLWREHRVVVLAYGLGILAVVAMLATGRNPLGTYGTTASGNIVPGDIVQQALAHLAAVAVGCAVLPFVVGGAWLASNLVRSETRERRVFAWLATIAIVLLTLEVASFDSRFGDGIVRDRYLFYLAAPLLVAFAAALTARRLPRLSLAVPVALFVAGVLAWGLPVYQKLNVDTPVAILDNYLRRTLGGVGGARGLLIAVAVVAALLVLEGALLLGRRATAVALAAIALVLLPLESAYAFQRLFRVNGTSGSPITLDESNVLGWVDRTVGPNAHVTMIPYPAIPGDYWAGVAFWWDLEFWNKSVDANAGQPGLFEGTPSTFPKTYLRFDPHTGRANVSPASDVAQQIGDARFHIAGAPLTFDRTVFLVQPEQPWRADWVTRGLYDDGWTRPKTPARIRVFGYPGQRGAVTRSLQLFLNAPPGVTSRGYRLTSNLGAWQGAVGGDQVTLSFSVCVPAGDAAEATLTVPQTSQIYGDPSDAVSFSVPRQAGLLVARVYLSGTIGPACKPAS